MTDLSQNIKNGQQFNVTAGSGAIAAGDVVEIGGPGGEAWSAGTADYAAVSPAGSILGQAQIVASAMPGSSRQPIARDKLGSIYLAGTNSSGNLVIYKFGPTGTLISSAVLDAAATSVNTAQLFQLQNGAFACVYARAAGALYFVVFDAALSGVAGPVNVASERAATNVVYHASCALSGGGFAVAYQTSAGTALNLVTYSNTGSVTQAAVSIQTLAGSVAQQFLRLGQLATGNLVCAFRGTMTAGGTAGTGFVIVTTAGGAVAGPTNMDSTAVLGFLELSVLPTTFCLAAANGTNLLAGVFNNAGAAQGAGYSIGNTLNSLTYPQIKLTNDGAQFWLVWFSSVANGIYVVGLSAGGAATSAASSLGASTLSASTFALDAEVVNNLLVVLAASNGALGQFLMSVGLPDVSLGIVSPYVRSAPVTFGTAAATTGSAWPRLLSGGGGLYQGSSPPPGQPMAGPRNGDFTVIVAYDQQNAASTYLGIQKVEPSAVVGTALTSVPASAAGLNVTVNPGPGDYPSNSVGGSSGSAFNHIGSSPSGTAGAIYSNGMALTGISSVSVVPAQLATQGSLCYFAYSSITSVKLLPNNGNSVIVSGKPVALPSIGVSASNTGAILGGVPGSNLAASTVYLVAMNASAQLGFWTLSTGFGPDANGVQVINGNPGWSLVGMVATNGSAQFSASLVISLFGQLPRVQKGTFTGNPSISAAAAPAELDSSIRVSFLTFGMKPVRFSNTGTVSCLSSSQNGMTGVAFDGIAPEIEAAIFTGMHTNSEGSSIYGSTSLSGAKTGLSAGLHYATLVGATFNYAGNAVVWQGGSATFSGAGGGTNPPNVLEITING